MVFIFNLIEEDIIVISQYPKELYYLDITIDNTRIIVHFDKNI